MTVDTSEASCPRPEMRTLLFTCMCEKLENVPVNSFSHMANSSMDMASQPVNNSVINWMNTYCLCRPFIDIHKGFLGMTTHVQTMDTR